VAAIITKEPVKVAPVFGAAQLLVDIHKVDSLHIITELTQQTAQAEQVDISTEIVEQLVRREW
jgi:hypothetical protein